MKTTRHKFIILGALLLLSVLVIEGIRLSQFIYPLLWGYFPFLVFPLLSRIISGLRMWLKITAKIILGIAGFTYILAGFYFLLQLMVCGYGPSKEQYASKKNSHFKIIGRDFSCYGTTGDLVLYKQFSISENIKLETYYQTWPDYQSMGIDTTKWKRLEHY